MILQGDIEAVASKSPMGLTALIEQVSGSEAHRQRYEELQVAAAEAEEKVGVMHVVPICPGINMLGGHVWAFLLSSRPVPSGQVSGRQHGFRSILKTLSLPGLWPQNR
jgi:hypothetical protein